MQTKTLIVYRVLTNKYPVSITTVHKVIANNKNLESTLLQFLVRTLEHTWISLNNMYSRLLLLNNNTNSSSTFHMDIYRLRVNTNLLKSQTSTRFQICTIASSMGWFLTKSIRFWKVKSMRIILVKETIARQRIQQMIFSWILACKEFHSLKEKQSLISNGDRAPMLKWWHLFYLILKTWLE